MKEEYFYNFGYDIFGKLLFDFSLWLYDNLKKKDINKVYFLARDGYILKKSFDIVKDDKIVTFYLYASRRSIIVPSLFLIDDPLDIFKCITFSERVTIREFLRKVGLEDYDFITDLNKNNLSYDEMIDTNNLNADFLNFLNGIFNIIKTNSQKEYNALIQYLSKNNFEGKVAVVDIGWHGTMQNAIQRISNSNVYGFYMGCITKYDHDKEFGYLFNSRNDKNYDIIHNFLSLFEFLFLAQEGSTKKFVNKYPYVELYNYEYKGTDELFFVEKIQNGAIDYIRHNISKISNTVFDNKTAFKNLSYFFLHPKLKDAKNFGDILFLDGNVKKIVNVRRWNNYLKNPKLIKKDYLSSCWRIGFLKSLFKLKFNYNLLNIFIRNIFLARNISIENRKVRTAILKADVISFDIFDTLIFRKTNNIEETNTIIQNEYNSKFSAKIQNFSRNRINAEKIARNKKRSIEIQFDDIYNEINYPEEVKKRLKKIEIDTELDICYSNRKIKEIFNFCREQNKRIIITSDMYLNEIVINEILVKNGYVYDQLYLSSTIKLTKSNGSIFDFILKQEKISRNKIIHFGDNFKSDYVRPMLKGIKSFRVK